jgi:hypothetical protein
LRNRLGSACRHDFDCAVGLVCAADGLCNTNRCGATPLADEICGDGLDNDCNGSVEDGCGYACARDDQPMTDVAETCNTGVSATEWFVPCGAVVTTHGSRSYASVNIRGRVFVTPLVADVSGTGELSITSTGALTVSGVIDATGAGYSDGEGPGAGTCDGGGGGYGGAGGGGHGCSSGGPTYGDAMSMDIQMGSSGASGDDTPGRGGGAVTLSAQTVVVTAAGAVLADGSRGTADDSTDEGGGGSGGGILLSGGTQINVAGTLSCRGAAGWDTGFASGGGGGGRIKLIAPTGTMTGVALVTGGAGGSSGPFTGAAGASGTFYQSY